MLKSSVARSDAETAQRGAFAEEEEARANSLQRHLRDRTKRGGRLERRLADLSAELEAARGDVRAKLLA